MYAMYVTSHKEDKIRNVTSLSETSRREKLSLPRSFNLTSSDPTRLPSTLHGEHNGPRFLKHGRLLIKPAARGRYETSGSPKEEKRCAWPSDHNGDGRRALAWAGIRAGISGRVAMIVRSLLSYAATNNIKGPAFIH